MGLVVWAGSGGARRRTPRDKRVTREPIDQQAEQHHQAKRDDALGLFHEDRGGQKERVLEEGEAAFHAALLFVRLAELLVRQLRGIEHIRRDQAGGLAPCLSYDGLLVPFERRLHPPLDTAWRHA